MPPLLSCACVQVILFWPVKIVVLVTAAGCVGASIWGVAQIETDFKLEWMLRDGNYVKTFLMMNSEYFPMAGFKARQTHSIPWLVKHLRNHPFFRAESSSPSWTTTQNTFLTWPSSWRP